MIYESPSGPPVLKANIVAIDWGTVAPGDTVAFALTPFNTVGQEVTHPFWPCPLSPMPTDITSFCVPANIEGAPAALIIVSNNSLGNIPIGVKRYAILFGELGLLL